MSAKGNIGTNAKNIKCVRNGHNSHRSYFKLARNWRKHSRPALSSVFPQTLSALTSSTGDTRKLSEYFTAPDSANEEHLHVIPIINPVQYPGWKLYFTTETFKEASLLVKQIKAFEEHVIKHPSQYVLQCIRKNRWFYIDAEFLQKDNLFLSSWVNFFQQLQDTPNIVLSCLGMAMHSVVTAVDNSNTESTSTCENYHNKSLMRKIIPRPVHFCTATNITEISRENCDKLFVINGRVDYVSYVQTKCTWVAFKCKCCGHQQAIRQDNNYPTKPLRCRIECNSKRNFIELRSSPYTKIDRIQTIQLGELEPSYGLSSSPQIDIELHDNLVDLVCPGTKITVTGVLKMKSLAECRKTDLQKGFNNNFYIQAVAVKHASKHPKNIYQASQKELEIVQMITREPNCLRLLVQSLAPDMCGQEMAKAAVLLTLFGGSGSQLHDEGELHVFLVGDPGLGKSKLLQNAAEIAKTGKLVSKKTPTTFLSPIQQLKQFTGGNKENLTDAGCILTSFTSHYCIDDMDKLSSNQEHLIHIIQAKSVATRSVNTAFHIHARTSIISAVNPAGGHYDSSKHLLENVRLNPSLISLFHLVFVLFDKADKYRDNMLAEHVKALHSGMKKVLLIPPKYSMEFDPTDGILKYDEIQLQERLKVNADEQLDLLPTLLLKKYIAYARQNVKPLLTNEAVEEIKEFYLSLRREKNDENRLLITSRQLEGLIRLTQARARVDLCPEATKIHACDVIELLRHSYTNTSVGDQSNITINESIIGTSLKSQVKKFIQMIQLRSNVLGKTIFEFEELKDMASRAGIRCSVTNLVELVNMQGYLLKKGPNLYEVRTD